MESTLELMKALLQFIVLFGLVLALAWFTTRFAGLRLGAYGRGGIMRVLQHIPAGRERSIMLLEVGGRVYLLGITAEQINLLDTMDDPDMIKRMVETAANTGAITQGFGMPESFKEALMNVLGRFGQSPPGTRQERKQSELDDATGRLQERIEQLRRFQNKE